MNILKKELEALYKDLPSSEVNVDTLLKILDKLKLGCKGCSNPFNNIPHKDLEYARLQLIKYKLENKKEHLIDAIFYLLQELFTLRRKND